MDIENIFKKINFNIKPSDNYRKAYLFRFKKGLYKLIGLDKKFTFSNCIIENNFENIKLKRALLKIDSMSTYAIGHLVNQICQSLSDNQIYLNIGCWKGFTLISGMIDTSCKVIGVDNFSQFDGPKNEFYSNFSKYQNGVNLNCHYSLNRLDMYEKVNLIIAVEDLLTNLFNYKQKSVCGLFSEFVRNHAISERTIDPMFSISALGYNSKSLTVDISNNSFDQNSFFSRFHQINGKICNFNLNAGSTFVHYLERILEVDYRFDKEFSGVIIYKESRYNKKWITWVRNLNNSSTNPNFHQLTSEALNKNLFKKINVGNGYLGTISADDKFNLIKKILPDYPFFYFFHHK